MFCVAKVFAVHFSIAMSAKRNSSRIVACKDDECVPVVFTPVKKVKSVESSLSVTPEARASYSAAMKELCESLTPEEEVNICMIKVVVMLWFRLLRKPIPSGQPL
jgi:hypothetical protein